MKKNNNNNNKIDLSISYFSYQERNREKMNSRMLKHQLDEYIQYLLDVWIFFRFSFSSFLCGNFFTIIFLFMRICSTNFDIRAWLYVTHMFLFSSFWVYLIKWFICFFFFCSWFKCCHVMFCLFFLFFFISTFYGMYS